MSAVLELDRLSLSFGGLRALSELDLQVSEREVVSVIGPNGAGKTTVFNVITGVYEPSAGDVRFAAQPGSASSPARAARSRGRSPVTAATARAKNRRSNSPWGATFRCVTRNVRPSRNSLVSRRDVGSSMPAMNAAASS